MPQGLESYDVSRLFIYYNARLREAEAGNLEDAGSSIIAAIDSLKGEEVLNQD
jgi:hypothetical protein